MGVKKPTLSIIIGTWNRTELTIRCLRSLENNTTADLHIIWIDNGSEDREHEAMKAFVKTFDHDMERHPEPLGFAKTQNKGIPYIKGDYTVFMNNDLTVAPGWEEDLIRTVDETPGGAGPVGLGYGGGWQSIDNHPWLGIPENVKKKGRYAVAAFLRSTWTGKAVDLPLFPNKPPWRGMLAFYCVLFPSKIVREVGLLDEQFGWGFCEDDDYCKRVRNAGYSLSLCPASLVDHKAGQTLGQLQDDWLARFEKNKKLYEEKWGEPLPH